MQKQKRNRIIILIISLISISIGIYIILNTLSSNIMFFQTPAEIKANQSVAKKIIRVGGMVRPGSVMKIDNTMITEFILTDCKDDLKVHYKGILPSLFREGQGIIAKGSLNGENVFYSEELLVKHDENYMPIEMKQNLARSPLCDFKSRNS